MWSLILLERNGKQSNNLFFFHFFLYVHRFATSIDFIATSLQHVQYVVMLTLFLPSMEKV